MAVRMRELLADLEAESDDVVRMLLPLDEAAWERPTPAEGWAVRDQVSHLAYFDETALLSATDPERFRAGADEAMRRATDFADAIVADYRDLPGARVLAWFRKARADLLAGFAGIDPSTRLPWYGPSMSAASSITARLMETWAHGQDIADALGLVREPSMRLRHVAHLGVRAMPFSFALHSRAAPERGVRVELTAPDSTVWSWGPEEASDSVRGTALDFCLAVTQRRHLDDTALRISGAAATEWLSIAQAYAGPPGSGRPAGAHLKEVP